MLLTRNRALRHARKEKIDEFYTQITDIEKELGHYEKHFKGKTVYCNCDDPRVSNFFRYFSLNFERLGLKRLITTCYKSDDANKAIGSLEAKIAELTEAVNQLEEKVAAGIEPSSPFGLLKQNLAASAGSAIIPVGSRFAALGLMYLTGIPADAIAATAAYLSSKSYK